MRRPAFHFRGIPVFIDWWTALMAAVLADYWTSDLTAGPIRVVVIAAFAISVIGSVFLHEIGHAVVGKAYGEQPAAIVLSALGGATHMRRNAATPKAMVVGAIVGPVLNGVLGLATIWAVNEPGYLAFVGRFGVLNVALAIYNLLPAFPLDGGHALTGLLWGATGDLQRSVARVAVLGQLLALAMFAVAAGSGWFDITGQILLMWLAATIFFSSRAMQNVRTAVPAVQRAIAVDRNDSVADAIAQAEAQQARHILVTANDQIVGAAIAHEVKQLTIAQRQNTVVAKVSVALPPEAFIKFADPQSVAAGVKSGSPICVVLDNEDAIVGVIQVSDLVGTSP